MDFDFGPVDSLEKVPAQFKPLYATEASADGKFIVAETFRGTSEAFVGLGRALKAERAAAKNRTTVDLTPLADYGDTVEKIAEGFSAKLRTMQEELAKGGKINLDKVKAEFAQAHQGEITKITTRATALQNQLYELMVDQAATAALAKEKGSTELLLPLVRQSVKVAEQDGKFSVFVVDPMGDRRYSGVTGEPMSIVELVAEMKSDKRFARAFDAEAPAGGGMTPGSGKGNGRPLGGNGVEKSSVDKIRAGLAKGLRHEAR
jgi:hypothetical protein